MKKILIILVLALCAVSCVNSFPSSQEKEQKALFEARKNIQLPDSCLQFDSIGLGMKFSEAKIIVKSDSDFSEVRECEFRGDSVLEFKHIFHCYNGEDIGLSGKVIEYNDSVETIVLESLSVSYDYPVYEHGRFLHIAKTYADKYEYEPKANEYSVDTYTTRTEYGWRKVDDTVIVMFDLEKVKSNRGGYVYTGRTCVRYLDLDLNRLRLKNNQINRERENKERRKLPNHVPKHHGYTMSVATPQSSR